MTRHRIYTLLLLAVLTLSALGAQAALPPPIGGELTLSVPHAMTILDPALAANVGERQASSLVAEPLVTSDGRELGLNLLLSVERAESQRSWLFRLKPGVRFHDGTMLEAADVKASYERLLHGGAIYPAARRLLAIRGASKIWQGNGELKAFTVVSPLEFAIETEGVVADFPHRLAHPALAILPAYQAKTARIVTPVGTGPFAIDSQSPGRVTLTAFADYHGGRAYLDRVRLVHADSRRDERKLVDERVIDGLLYPRIQIDAAAGRTTAAAGYRVGFAFNPGLDSARQADIRRLLLALIDCKALAKLFEARRIAPFDDAKAPKPVTVRGPDKQLAQFTAVMAESVGTSCAGFALDEQQARTAYSALGLSGPLVVTVREDMPELVMLARRLALEAKTRQVPLLVKVLDSAALSSQRPGDGWHIELGERPVFEPAKGLEPGDLPLYRLAPQAIWLNGGFSQAGFVPFGTLALENLHRSGQ